MSTIHKSYKFRIYPNSEQRKLLAKHFGSTRFVWNYFLAERKKSYLENEKTLNYHDNAKALTLLKKIDEYSWLYEVNAQSLQASLQDLDTAYGKFFKKLSTFPKFKSKYKSNNSFRCLQRVSIKNNKLEIPKFKNGNSIKITIHRKIGDRILYVTISKTTTNKYFASITCETECKPLPATGKQIGIDLGIKNLAICSDNIIFENIKTTKKYSKKLSYEQKQLSKKIKGSNNRNRQRLKVASVYEKIKNVRLDNIHKITKLLISENQTIVDEDLNIKGMIKNPKLAKAIKDASWGELTRCLEYKSEWYGRDFVKIDKWFPSSKTCNVCAFINQDLSLKDRKWICPSCDAVLDRDLNASKNILKQGLKILSGCGTQSDIKQKRGEASVSNQSLTHEA